MFQNLALLAIAVALFIAGLITGATLKVVSLLPTRHALHKARRALNTALRHLEETQRELNHAHYDATHDALTDLPNRRALAHHLADALAAEEQVSVALIDLDHFKSINDVHGHNAGDALLCHVADLLLGLPAPVRQVARLGGDEFVLVIDGDGYAGVSAAEAALRAIAGTSVDLLSGWVTVTGSAGVAATWPGITYRQLLHHADIAMFRAKRAGGGVLFDPDGRTRSVDSRPRARHRDRQRGDRGTDPATSAEKADPHQPRR